MHISKENKIFLSKVFLISLPVIFQELINSSINIADTMMIGSLGETAITAVALGNQVFFIFILIVFGINSGASVFMGQFWGIKDTKSIHKTIGISLISSLLVSFIFLILSQTIPEKLLLIYTRDEEIIKIAVDYLKIVSITYPFYAISFVINMANKSTEKTQIPMVTTIVTLLVNITLNAIFIFVLGMGVKGAALGTLIARITEVLTQVFLIKKLKLPILGKFKNYFSASKTFIQEYYKKALPVILNEIMWATGVTLYMVAYGLVKASESPQASVQIANTIKQLFMVVGIGIGSSSSIILGNLLGANEIDKARLYAKKFTKLVFFIGIIMSSILFILSPYIVSFFDVSESVRMNTIQILRVISITMTFVLLNFLNVIGILRAGGDTLFCLILDAGTVWLVGVPLAFLGVYLNSPIYVVFALASCAEIIAYVLSSIRVKSNKWAVNIIGE